MDELYAKIGKQHLELEQRKEGHTKLLRMLASVVSGEIDRSRVLVNLTDETYSWTEPGTRPGRPATFNGMPYVVMAPDEPAPVPVGPINGLPEVIPAPESIPETSPEAPPG